MRWLGFDWGSVRHGLWLGSAIGVGFTLAQIIEHAYRCSGWCHVYP